MYVYTYVQCIYIYIFALKGRAAIVLTAQPKGIKMWCIDPRKETGETPQPARKRHPRREEKGGSNSLTSNKENQAPHCPPSQGGRSKKGPHRPPKFSLALLRSEGQKKEKLYEAETQELWILEEWPCGPMSLLHHQGKFWRWLGPSSGL